MNNTYNLNSFKRDINHNEDILMHVNHMIGKNKEPTESELIPNNCLYTCAHMSIDFSYYVLECLGPGKDLMLWVWFSLDLDFGCGFIN